MKIVEGNENQACLYHLRRVDETIDKILENWEGGEYPTYEHALIDLCLKLHYEKDELQSELEYLKRKTYNE